MRNRDYQFIGVEFLASNYAAYHLSFVCGRLFLATGLGLSGIGCLFVPDASGSSIVETEKVSEMWDEARSAYTVW